MTELDFTGVPDVLRPAARDIERLVPRTSDLRGIPACLGWQLHAGVRVPEHPLRTHVCASSYDHLILDLDDQRVRALYAAHPQLRTTVGLAGLPGELTSEQALSRLRLWGAARDASEPIGPDTVYAAEPLFLLHEVGHEAEPRAIVACDYRIAVEAGASLEVDVTLHGVATDPRYRRRGLAHLALLEAARWLGMLTRSLHIADHRPHRFVQRIHALPAAEVGYHLAQVFRANFGFFAVTADLVENARLEREDGITSAGSKRSGIATITGFAGVEDMIHAPDGIAVAG